MSEAHHHEAPSVPFEDLPTRLKLSRWKLGLEQEEMAARLGLHRRTIANYETGATEPKLALLMSWAHLTNVPLDWLTFGVHACPHCGNSLTGDDGGGNERRTCFSENPTSEDSEVLRPDFGSAPEQPEGELDATVYSFPAASIDPAAQHAE